MVITYPILFTYRHSMELYLKILGQHDHEAGNEGHSFGKLMDKQDRGKIRRKLPGWMRDRLYDFHNIDSGATLFR